MVMDEREKSPILLELHKVLTARYPCLCDCSDDEVDDCPSADGPMINNFNHDMGMLAISFSRVDEVVPFIIEAALALNIIVADAQTNEIHRVPPIKKDTKNPGINFSNL
ncbi:hypothetical protein [Limnobaculum parvum]|uniref:Uncharacterized protein n=1 Tax=Limnobaculum parvum TaxID=2172103 RepID=A0A2Y9TXB6_9GAMM|nr:hypothetical protein [Limnobaculum parvum]AWH88357.1 hypothetical protein HYN51_07185 [Limnobaculum parvum]